MIKRINVAGYECHISKSEEATTATYLIYPAVVPFEDAWIERMSETHKITLVVIYVPADKWNDSLTPWPEPGEAKGFPPFAGKAAEFLSLLQQKIIPAADQAADLSSDIIRDLIGVSLSGLFTLWQWLQCSDFRSIGSLSGSFWYSDFIEWFEKQKIPVKTGKAYFLLGKDEPKARVKAYQTVGIDTEKIVTRLKDSGVDVTFEWVPGNHFSRPVHRAERALEALYPTSGIKANEA